MKKTMAIILLLAALGMLAYLSVSIRKGYLHKRSVEANRQSLPEFNFQNLAGGQFSTRDLMAEQPTLIVYFQPDCGHCQYEVQMIRDSLHLLTATNVLLVSDASVEELLGFVAEYDLLSHLDELHLLYDSSGGFKQHLGMSRVPSIFIYDAERKLVRHYQGETKMETIIKHLKP
jgi:peroxiredoxin